MPHCAKWCRFADTFCDGRPMSSRAMAAMNSRCYCRTPHLLPQPRWPNRFDEVAATPIESAALSASIGLATFPTHAQTAKALIDAADRALYRAKQTRNAIACAE